MSGEYALGTVATVTGGFHAELPHLTRRAFRCDTSGWTLEGGGFFRDRDVTDVRPLVVLDAMHENGWSHAIHALRVQTSSSLLWDLADQIEAQTQPPKPAEPTGLGAVVEDARGEFWVRKGNTEHGEDWARQIGNAWTGGGWDRIDVVRVLSEGWSA